MADTIRVLIADDHPIVRTGVRLLLESEPDMEVVGEATNGDQALALAAALRPAVVLMDMGMPGMNGLEATRQIRARFPAIRVVALTMHRSDEYFFRMLEAGATGYVLKGAATDDLIDAIRDVANGLVALHPAMTGRLLTEYLESTRETGDRGGSPSLTPRESEVLRLLAEGYGAQAIATRLFVSPSTIHTHRANLMRKLGLSSRHDLIQYARRRGLLPEF